MPITDMGILSEFAVIRHAGTTDTGIGLGLGIREQIRKIAVSAIGKACVVDAGSDECCGIVIGGSRNQRGCGETGYLYMTVAVTADDTTDCIRVIGTDLAVVHLGIVNIGMVDCTGNAADVRSVTVNMVSGTGIGADVGIDNGSIGCKTDNTTHTGVAI